MDRRTTGDIDMAALSTSTAMGQILRSRPRRVVAFAAVAIAAAASILTAGVAISLLTNAFGPAAASSGPMGLTFQHVLRENGVTAAGAISALDSYRRHVLRENA
jgi:ABC-type Co2+ transport system permease subunit